jgi:hypothetical protein
MENIEFQLKFKYTYNDILPDIRIYIDDDLKMVTQNEEHCKFWHKCDFSDHVLRIERTGKTNRCPEQTVELKQVVVDGIDIRNILWIKSYNENYWPEPWATQQREAGEDLEKYVEAELLFGHNCTWRLPFTSPFYNYVMDWLR